MTIKILQNCLVFDGHNEDLFEASIAIEDNRIRELSDREINIDGAELVNCNGRFLMPGLIDGHFHAMIPTFDISKLDNMPASLVTAHAGRILNGALHRGFTCVRDAAGSDVGIYMALQQGLIEGPRMFYSGKAISQTGGHGDMRAGDLVSPCACGYQGAITEIADGEDEMRKKVREELRKGAHQIKIFVSGGVLSPTDPIWMPQFSENEIRVAVEEAATRRTYVMAHCHTDERAQDCVRLGVRSIEHGTEIAAGTAGMIADSDTYVVPTLSVIRVLRDHGPELGIPPMALEKIDGLFDTACQSVENCDRAGVKLGFGTDLLGDYHPKQNNEFLHRGDIQANIDVLRSATSVNASLLRQEDQLGCIKEGALADIILVEGNPLQDISVLSEPGPNIPLIMRDGVIVKNQLSA